VLQKLIIAYQAFPNFDWFGRKYGKGENLENWSWWGSMPQVIRNVIFLLGIRVG